MPGLHVPSLTREFAVAIEANDDIYQRAVYEDPDTKGVMHQVFRQNEVERELLKAVLRRCGG